MSKATSARGSILETARELTEGDRNKSYNEPSVQLGLAGLLKDTLWGYCEDQDIDARTIGDAEREAIDQVLTKLSRVVVGREVKRDNYVDMAAYAAIAGECAEKDAAVDFDFEGAKRRVDERLADWSKRGVVPSWNPDDISDAGVPKDADPDRTGYWWRWPKDYMPGTFGETFAQAAVDREAKDRERRLRKRTTEIYALNWPTCPRCRAIAEREA